jgi:hypothetical protein
MSDGNGGGQTRRAALKLLGATTVAGGLAVAGAQSAQAAWPNAFKTISTSGTFSVDFQAGSIYYRVSEGWSLTSTTATLNFITVKNLGREILYFSTFVSADGGTPTVNIPPFSLNPSIAKNFYPRRIYNKRPGTKITTQDIRGSIQFGPSFINAVEWRRS